MMIQRNSRRYRFISALIWISVCLVVFSGILVLILSGSDDYRQCKAPLDVAPYRGIGIGVNVSFSRLISNTDGDDDGNPQTFPNPSDISLIMDQDTAIPYPSGVGFPKFSNLLWAWLQMISYDLIYTRPSNATDTIFAGNDMPELIRSFYILDDSGDRQQINFASPYLDGSTVYGLSVSAAYSLRRMDGTGKLKTLTTLTQDSNDAELLFEAVDSRIYQNPLLASLHVLMVREHNYWCDRLKYDMDYLSENELFNIARHFVIAEMQSITYREVLPLFLGIDALDASTCFTHIEFNNAHAIKTKHGKKYTHHTSILNEFAIGATHVIQSMMPAHLLLRDPQTGEITQTVNTTSNCNDQSLLWLNGIDDILLGASLQPANKRDIALEDMIRLYRSCNDSNVLDLGAINIARERDHRIPSYQDFYRHFNKLSPIVSVSCEEFSYSNEICELIVDLYGSDTAPIDLFLGLLIEKRYAHSTLGIVGTNLFKYQFSHIKHNDHYFYLWDRVIDGYVVEVHNIRLSKIILRNTNIDSTIMDPNVFLI